MKKNKYIIKYTIPNRWGQFVIFYSFIEMKVIASPGPEEIHKSISSACISDVYKSKGVSVEMGEIDFLMISLVDTELTPTT